MAAEAEQQGLRLYETLDQFKPDPLAQIHNPNKGLWCLRPCSSRKIDEDVFLHESVLQRKEDSKKTDYFPGNLPKVYREEKTLAARPRQRLVSPLPDSLIQTETRSEQQCAMIADHLITDHFVPQT